MTIGNYAFYAAKLKSISIPNRVTSIVFYCFKGPRDLHNVFSYNTTPPTLGSNTFQNSNCYQLVVPSGTRDAYIAAGWDSPFTYVSEPAIITIDDKSRYYGSANPTFTYSMVGGPLANGPSLSCSANANSPAGTYSIVGSAGSSVVPITFTNTGTLTVNKKPVTITAKAQTITYGNSISTGTSQVTSSGLVSGHTLSSVTLTPSTSNVTTNGTITPSAATITYNSTDVTANYDITYNTGKLTINAKSVSTLTVDAIAAQTYTGSAITPTVTVKDGSTTLTSGTHYTVSYSNNINAGTATVTITGKGNYTGTKSANFTINAKNASNLTIFEIAAVTYNGSAFTPTVTVKDGSTTLTSGTHYTVSYSNNINAGTATVTITGKGNYTGTKSANFTINAKSASNLTISEIAAVTYNGSAQTPTVTVNDGTTTLVKDIDYTVSYSNNIDVGTATVTITGKGNYTGTKTANFTINPLIKDVSSLTISDIAAVTYNGSAQTPTVTVMDESTTLTNGTDYTVAYSNNTNAGTATATITGMGNYTGSRNVNFTINKAPLTITANSYTIDQGDAFPEFSVNYSGFQNGETSTVLTTQPTITCDATDSETAGVFDITPSGAAATNYSFNYVKGTLTIEALWVSITLNSLGKGTYCSEYPIDFTSVSGIYAYIVSGFKPSAGNLIVTRVYEVPAGTGLYIVGTPGSTYNIPIEPTDFYYSNMMKGVMVATKIPANEDGYTNYVLGSDGNGGVIFKRANNTSSPANRAYVQIPSSLAGAREVLGMETDDDSTTGLDGVFTSNTKEAEGEYYNLRGQKVQTPQRGLYIKNGKKIFIH